MRFRNSVRLLLNNFKSTYVILLFRLVVFLITGSLAAVILAANIGPFLESPEADAFVTALEDIVATFFNSPDTQAAMYSLPEGGTITMGYFDLYNMPVSTSGPADVPDTKPDTGEDYYGELDQAQAQAVYEAVLQDAREGNIKETGPFDPAEVLGNLSFDYTISRRPQTGDSDGYSNSIYGLNINVYETMEHTIQALEDVGAFPTGSGNPELMPLPDPEAYEVVPLPSTEQA